MVEQYEKKFEKERARGMSKEGMIEAKLREQKMKRMEEYEKSNPTGKREFEVSQEFIYN